MKLNRKLEIVEQGLVSISSHQDADASVRLAALEAVDKMIDAQRAAIEKEVADSIKTELAAE